MYVNMINWQFHTKNHISTQIVYGGLALNCQMGADGSKISNQIVNFYYILDPPHKIKESDLNLEFWKMTHYPPC